MRRHLLAFVCCLLPALAIAAQFPPLLRVVDVRGTQQPELVTRLGSLQGTLNRRHDDYAVFIVRNDDDAALANSLVAMYHLQKEILTPGALLDEVKPTLTGQVRYDRAQPWTRNIALTVAALSPGAVIATDIDLGAPTVLDARNRWDNRCDAYTWLVDNYGERAESSTLALAPESGNLLADVITARGLLAVDLAPTDPAEAALLTRLIRRLPAGGRILGMPDNRCGATDATLWQLTALLGNEDRVMIPARDTANLSCLSRFPVTRPLLQSRDEQGIADPERTLTLIYGGENDVAFGSPSLDYALNTLPNLLASSSLSRLPVGIEVPEAVRDYAPAVYQLLLARVRDTPAELIAAPNGEGWALPMSMRDPLPYLQRSAQRAADMDLVALSLLDRGGQQAYQQTLGRLANIGWRGIFVRPVAPDQLPDGQPRAGGVLPNFSGLVGTAHVHSAEELRTAVAKLKGPFSVIYLDPQGVSPAEVRDLLPEISGDRELVTPSQLLRMITEYAALTPWLQAKVARGIANPRREPPTLTVSTPTTALTAPTAADAIPITVHIDGQASVLVARLVYKEPDGHRGTADLHDTGNGVWVATLPPMLQGGQLSVKARVVENGGFGVTFSDQLTIKIPSVDTDRDGVDDTREEYQGTDPRNWDTDGDGLADGADPSPTERDRKTLTLLPAIFPPDDAPQLVDSGASTTNAKGRTLPAGSQVIYRLPLTDVPIAPSTLRLVTRGPGNVRINTDAPVPLFFPGDGAWYTNVPISTAHMEGKELRVTITAGDAPVRVQSLRLTSNYDGPYLYYPRLSPEYPPANTPITVTATVFSSHEIKTVRVCYGTTPKTMKSVEMQLTVGMVYTAVIPAQPGGSIMIYNIEAEDTAGHLAVSPYKAVPIGRPRKHSVAYLGSRDLQGSWQPDAVWDDLGRSLTGPGEDKAYFRPHTGTYTVWLLAQPSQRGIHVNITSNPVLSRRTQTFLDDTIPAGSVDGWYRLGTMRIAESIGMTVSITPDGPSGYCAYGQLIFTQDDQFTPPLAHAGLDWFNTIAIAGVANGQVVTGTITLTVLTTGNIDAIAVTAEQKRATAGARSLRTIPFTRQYDGKYTLDTRGLNPGEYEITAAGMRLTTEDGKPDATPLVAATLRVIVPNR